MRVPRVPHRAVGDRIERQGRCHGGECKRAGVRWARNSDRQANGTKQNTVDGQHHAFVVAAQELIADRHNGQRHANSGQPIAKVESREQCRRGHGAEVWHFAHQPHHDRQRHQAQNTPQSIICLRFTSVVLHQAAHRKKG